MRNAPASIACRNARTLYGSADSREMGTSCIVRCVDTWRMTANRRAAITARTPLYNSTTQANSAWPSLHEDAHTHRPTQPSHPCMEMHTNTGQLSLAIPPWRCTQTQANSAWPSLHGDAHRPTQPSHPSMEMNTNTGQFSLAIPAWRCTQANSAWPSLHGDAHTQTNSAWPSAAWVGKAKRVLATVMANQ